MKYWNMSVVGLLMGCLVPSALSQETFEGVDVSTLETIFESKVLPESSDGKLLYRYMTSVGNGHIATTAYSDSVYMNGLFSGYKGETHRARIPSRNSIRLVDKNGMRNNFKNASYFLDVDKGLFVERFTGGGFQIELKMFAHRYYHKIMVNQIYVKPLKANPMQLELKLTNNIGPEPMDINFGQEEPFESAIPAKSQCGQVVQVEDPYYQQNNPTVCIIFTENPEIIRITSEVQYTFIAAYDSDLYGASGDFTTVVNLISKRQHEEILNSHVDAWRQVWEDGRIVIEGNLELQKVVHGCLYYIISSLPVTTDTYSYVSQFYGLSPGGLANGGYMMDYQGHIFWDMEIFVFPVVLYFYPEMAREILNYRLSLLQPARKLSQDTGFKGARYPWEGSVSGIDVTPDCCPDNFLQQVHITADIAFAIRQYVVVTKDFDWLKTPQPNYPANGCGFIRELAEFWEMEVLRFRNNFHGLVLYETDVMGPNDDKKHIKNNGFTNVAAAYAIFFAKYAECLCNGSMNQVPDEWLNVAKSIKLIYDESLNYHPAYEGYQKDEQIKQADAILLGFPLMYEMDPKTRENNLNIYEQNTRKNGPGMTWAMHTIGLLELDETTRAEALFTRSYKSYIREPFKIWTEVEPPALGAVNYITGMGGFLQSIVSGYGGYRLLPEKILFFKPRVPPNSNKLKLIGLAYLGNIIDVIIETTKVTIFLRVSSPIHYIQIISGNSTYDFSLGQDKIELQNGNPPSSFTISPIKPSECPLPIDMINAAYTKPNSSPRTKICLSIYSSNLLFIIALFLIFSI